MSQKLMMLAILCVAIPLTSCQTPTIAAKAPQAASTPVQAVPCPSLPPISYAAPKTLSEAQTWLGGKLPDPTNQYDTPATVDQIRKSNAAIAAVCATP